MRTEKEMLDLIINTAKNDERIRGAYMSGSRANANAPRDIFQDYDIMYVVHETESFQKDKTWIDRFGERLYMQYPEDSDRYTSDRENCYGWLIQFADGNRLDLHVETLSHVAIGTEDGMYLVLLDKDNCIPKYDKPSDEFFWVKKPSETEYLEICNEFWWCLNNVAKGLWRDEPTYALEMLNEIVRPQLMSLLSWKVGIMTDFSVSVGKSGKYLHKWLSADEWDRFLKTYCGADIEDIWNSVFIMCDLFDEIAIEVAEKLNLEYNIQEAKNSRLWLEKVRDLPKYAKDI